MRCDEGEGEGIGAFFLFIFACISGLNRKRLIPVHVFIKLDRLFLERSKIRFSLQTGQLMRRRDAPSGAA
jgi:hypothetical protein